MADLCVWVPLWQIHSLVMYDLFVSFFLFPGPFVWRFVSRRYACGHDTCLFLQC